MAFGGIDLDVHNSNGTSSMYTDLASTTFQNVLDTLKTGQGTGGAVLRSGSVHGTGQEIGLSLTEGGTPLTLSNLVTSVFPDEGRGTLYALYPEPSDTLRIYSDDTKTTLLGTYSITAGGDDPSITSIASSIGISIPQNANGFYYDGTTYGLNDPIRFRVTLTTVDGYFTYPKIESITGFYLDGTEYKFEGGGGTADGISTSQPSNPVAGSTYYDTTNKVVKVYNGTSWEEVGGGNVIAMTQAAYDALPAATKNDGKLRIITDAPEIEIKGGNYTAGNGIDITNSEIGLDGMYNKTITHSDMQGPSPNGFHVPEITEWKKVKTIMDGLSLTTTNSWKINLHMPLAGYRGGYSGVSRQKQGQRGPYWSSSPHLTSYHNAYVFILGDPSIVTNDYNRCNAIPVRCFKDSYAAPDSSWTVVQGILGSAGIFWNQSEGLISITDGTTGYTMMDKNLGATTVYNDGDTLTQANMGNMYQWGNNYGFPSTGTISKTSSTQVDASSYGPTNPYFSDTFITGSGDWSSVRNDNLWGGATKGTWVSQMSGNLIVGDKLYKIVTSTSAPASGTAGNIITIVTE